MKLIFYAFNIKKQPTLKLGLHPQQVAYGDLQLWVFSVSGVDVRLTVSPEEKGLLNQDKHTQTHYEKFLRFSLHCGNNVLVKK